MLPAVYDLTLGQRATFRHRFKIPLDFTDREICAQVWKVQKGDTGRNIRVSKVLDFSVDFIDRALVENGVTKGVFDLVASYEQTKQLVIGADLEYDLLVVDGTVLHSGDRFYWLNGRVLVDPGLSDCSENS
jgi:hypothetical protein